jgi:hypothetical protein
VESLEEKAMKDKGRFVRALLVSSGALLIAVACGGRTSSYGGRVGQNTEASCRVACERLAECGRRTCGDEDVSCDDYGDCYAAPQSDADCRQECTDDCTTDAEEAREEFPECVDEMQTLIECVMADGCRDCIAEAKDYEGCREMNGDEDDEYVSKPSSEGSFGFAGWTR